MFHHITVLKEEATEGLNIKQDGIYVDCTLGGGGHSSVIASKLGPGGRLIALDQDDWALDNAREKLAAYGERVTLVKTNFRDLEQVLKDLDVPMKDGVPQVDGILYDLGVSSPQFDEGERGFSYNHDAPLDMRMDQDAMLTAKEIVNEWPEEEIARILYRYGEEKFSRRIARVIVGKRAQSTIETTGELVELIKEGIPAAARRTGGHPAKRSFQALRIAVNDELGAFEEGLHQAVRCLAPGGRVSVITFHSLEDRICKQIFSSYLEKCTCPPDFPLCVCGGKGTLRLVNRKPLIPTETELTENSRARSAKLRVAEKL
ncbi:16S rRNA (cytosine(1402)-N(4))-methyltransferase RsmH [Paenibacillus sp. FSL H7-0942]|uniref:Ribosomal RNA small subunit methyltransferase H n=1 Tax=Paenibacillus amylolyticus TaxID=1451 RepID=A0ABD8AN03_PAEAM|nr:MULTISPECIES: 16S rRNA (cytosine(1402)-N(4))-methyltransferase RsmH [Paenibacillus]APO46889.1 16S rRNA (cytosine(1402)-N(4))-methyltransferase [Paenibacillus xylanexedens]ETT29309.1 16S rRNA m(4)C1402 methyltransferase [Paenibacillus sp. FSL R5-192]MCP1422121.1 16S rRNA (cytosine1402-N4)-methyltransferase [Paenibacillus xylanexedens]OMF06485.1 16S rRNA (cytosine(1402)-N(4))-methyltransferase [Paenibacillus amylolyticus]WFA85842.1 16S rRNA (cytosine(1402)-N(4))-methyltransferase RsmH [Paenib